MADRFIITAGDEDGFQYRVRIERVGYSGAVTELPAAAPAFDIAVGRNSPKPLWRPIEESSAQIRVIDDAQELAEIFNAGRREYPVTIERRAAGSTGTYSTIWRGFVRPDFYQDDVNNRSVAVLEAVDGLALLKSESAAIRLQPESYQEAVRRLLDEVGYQLPTRFAIPYYPSLIASSSNIEKLDVRWEGLRELTKYDALRTLLAAFGAQLVQSKGEWYVQTRTSIAQGLGWRRYDTSGTVTTGTLPAEVQTFARNFDTYGAPLDSFRAAVSAVQVTHDHEDIPNVLQNPGFEDGSSATDIDGWTLTQPGTGNAFVERVDWSTTNIKEATQENQWAIRALTSDGNSPFYDGPIFEQQSVTQLQAGRGEIIMQFIDGRGSFTSGISHRIRLETPNGFYLRNGSVQVLDDFLASDGDAGQLSIEAVGGAVGAVVAPVGARLPIRSGGNQSAHDATITLSEAWLVGDTTLFGNVSDPVDVTAVGPVSVIYYEWKPTSGAVEDFLWPIGFGYEPGTSTSGDDAEVRLRRQKWVLPTSTINGVPVGGRVTLIMEMITSSSATPSASLFDDFKLQPLIDGDKVKETATVASTAAADDDTSISTLIADAPFSQSLRGFRVDDTALVVSLPEGGGDQVLYDKEANVTQDWRVGAGSAAGTLSLIEIVARETLRTERANLRVIQRALSTRPDQVGDVWPATVLEDSGSARYTINRYQRFFGGRGAHVTCEAALLEDYGISGIGFALSQESRRSSTGRTSAGEISVSVGLAVALKIGVTIRQPTQVGATQWVVSGLDTAYEFESPRITGTAQTPTDAVYVVRINGGIVGEVSITTAGAVSSTVPAGTQLGAGSVLTLAGPSSAADVDYLSLVLHLRQA